jgi:hypothetical protein
MSEYPKKLVSAEGGVALVKEAKDEATLKALGYKEEAPKEGDTFSHQPFQSRMKPKKKKR